MLHRPRGSTVVLSVIYGLIRVSEELKPAYQKYRDILSTSLDGPTCKPGASKPNQNDLSNISRHF
jgi:hypothetical protein